MIAKSPRKPLRDEVLAAALGLLLGLLVADDAEPHPDLLGLAQRGGDEQHRRQRPLHVVGAAPVEAVALQPRVELPGAAGNDVEVALQDDRRHPLARADLGPDHGQSPDLVALGLDPARLEPSLDEAGSLGDRLGLGGLVADQPLGERDELVAHPAEIARNASARSRSFWARACSALPSALSPSRRSASARCSFSSAESSSSGGVASSRSSRAWLP